MTKKIKAVLTINLGLYMDIRPEIEIEVPDELQGKELAEWLHTEYKGLYERKEQADRERPRVTKVNARERKKDIKNGSFEPIDEIDQSVRYESLEEATKN